MLIFLLTIGTWFGFANPIIQIPPLVICIPLIFSHIAKESNALKTTFKQSWIAGTIIYSSCLYWVAYPVCNYTNMPFWMGLSCPILLGLYLGLYSSVFCILLWYIRDLNWFIRGIISGLTWSSLEYIRGTLFTGFPWLNITQAFAPWPKFIQLIQFSGSFLFSGIIICIGIWIYEIRNKKVVPGTCAILSIIFIYIIGVNLYKIPYKSQKHISSLIVQGNIDQYEKWDKKFKKMTLNKYINITSSHLKNKLTLVIWPETAMPFLIQNISPLQSKLLNFVKKNNIMLLTGAPAYEIKGQKIQWYNRAYLISPKGPIKYYDKVHLVPFGEYVPMENIFPFLKKIVQGPGDFSAGRGIYPMKTRGIAIGTLICYEIIFPNLVANMVENGAQVLVNISNDAWFGDSSGPYQHLNQVILRAIEVKRYILRSTNTGISAIISPRGELKNIIPLNKEGAIYCNKVDLISSKTFFVRFYNIIEYVVFLMNILSFIIIWSIKTRWQKN